MAYILPQVIVFQEFDLLPDELVDTLRAHISGPHAHLLRYDDPDEKAQAALGRYDPTADNARAWPGRPAGATVDRGYTKVHVDGARLRYFEDLIGDGDTIAPISTTRVRLDGTYGFKASGDAYPRHPGLFARDVQPGDRVRVAATVAGTPHEVNTYVKAVEADPVEAAVGQAIEDTGNAPTQITGSTITQVAGTSNTITLATSLTNYSALADGAVTDTYTIEVTRASTGGNLTTAELRVTTASGRDDDLAVTPGAAAAAFPVGQRGLMLTFNRTQATDNLNAGQVFEIVVRDEYTAVLADSGGEYRGAQSTTYVVEFTRGGRFADPDPALRPQFRASTVHGTDNSAPLTVAAAGTAYPVGTQGVTLTLTGAPTGVRKGDRFYIAVTAVQDGRMSVLVLGHNLPTELVNPPAPDLDLSLYVERDIMVDELPGDAANWEQSDTEITLRGGLEAYDEEFTDAGEPVALPVVDGEVYVEYRAWLADLAGRVETISDVAELDDLIAGPLHPDNPLKWGVFKALSNANGSEVKFTAVAEPDSPDSWRDVLELLVGRDDVYNLVPLTFDRTVLDQFAAHVDAQSAPQNARWRALFGAVRAKSQQAVVHADTSEDGEVVLARIADDAGTSGIQHTWVTVPAGNGNFLANEVRPGDVVRTGYGVEGGSEVFEEYVVDEVVNEDTIRLVSGPEMAVLVPQKIEVWHHMNRDEIARDLAQQAGSFSSRRVKIVWPDTIGSGGLLQEGYFLAAALAGLRSGSAPHQGLTNVELRGFDDLSRTTDFLGGAQLNIMAEAGIWIVTQAPDGTVYNRHALTTDNLDVNTSEEMVTANIDAISYLFARRLAPYIGRMNVTASALMVLEVEIDAIINFLKTNGFIARLGAQLVDGKILKLQKHAILADRVVAVLDLELPYPMNNLELHLVV